MVDEKFVKFFTAAAKTFNTEKQGNPFEGASPDDCIRFFNNYCRLNAEEENFLQTAFSNESVYDLFVKSLNGYSSYGQELDNPLRKKAMEKIEETVKIEKDPKRQVEIERLLMIEYEPLTRSERKYKFLTEHTPEDIINIISKVLNAHGYPLISEEGYEALCHELDCDPTEAELDCQKALEIISDILATFDR